MLGRAFAALLLAGALAPAAAQEAASADGQWLLGARAAPPRLVLREAASGRELRTYPAASLTGEAASSVGLVLDNPPRRSFVAGFSGLRELWEISYDPDAPPIFDGLVHDYRMGEAIARSGFLGVRRTPLEERFVLLAVDASGRHVLGAGGEHGKFLDIMNLDVRRRIGRVALPAPLQPGAVRSFLREGRSVAAVRVGSEEVMVDVASARVLAPQPAAPR